MGIRVAGTGSYLPGPPLDQERVRVFLRRYPDALTEEIQERLLRESEIRLRHFAIDVDDESRRETNTSMAAAAGRSALDAAGWTPADVDLLVVTTIVPDQLMPPTSTLVQEALGIERCAEIEISANCSAPFKGIAFAVGQLRAGLSRRALVCSVQFSSFLGRPPWTNPASMGEHHGALRWIVSDGASAIALEQADRDTGLRVWLESSGVGERSGMSLALGAAYPDLIGLHRTGGHHVVQDDKFVLRVGVRRALRALERMFAGLGIDPATIDHFIPAVSTMQVARGFERLTADRLGVPPAAWRLNLERVGYLGGTGVLVVLDELARNGALEPGALVCSFAEESSKWMCAGMALRWNP